MTFSDNNLKICKMITENEFANIDAFWNKNYSNETHKNNKYIERDFHNNCYEKQNSPVMKNISSF